MKSGTNSIHAKKHTSNMWKTLVNRRENNVLINATPSSAIYYNSLSVSEQKDVVTVHFRSSGIQQSIALQIHAHRI